MNTPEVPNAEGARQHVIEALEADLIGPFGRAPGDEWSTANEVLRIPPSRWYLTGFIVPRAQEEIVDSPDDEDDEVGAGDDSDDEDSPSPDPSVKAPRRLPASLGISALVSSKVKSLQARVLWADYVRLTDDAPLESRSGSRRASWSRTPREPVAIDLPLDAAALRKGFDVAGSNGLRLEGHLEAAGPSSLAVAVFLVNARQPIEGGGRDEAYAFQVRLELECSAGFVARSNTTDIESPDFDERVNDLQFRSHCEFGVGHGVAVETSGGSGKVTRLSSTWMPRVDVPPVVQRSLPDVEVRMEALASLKDSAQANAVLLPLVTAYRKWISEQRAIDVGGGARAVTQKLLMDRAEAASRRIEEGIALLGEDEVLFEAFRLMNGVMAESERKARPDSPPTWRLFQLAFILLNLSSLTNPDHPDRKLVELIFFPTGGGKTQAYLGLIACTLLLRRLRGQTRPDKGLGVAVLLRYTLRLLTLDQLGRAATMICALELLRQKTPSLGDARFSIGLWVGRSATANTLAEVSKQVTEYKNDASPRAQSPFPLTHCPWCMSELRRDGFALRPSKTKPEEVVVGCATLECPFSLGKNGDGLPVLFVDEQVYRELPCFLVATVDKFALLPWRGETGMLLGRALGRTGKRFFGPCDPQDVVKKAAIPLPKGLLPPELIVQDELHLISGPLGSMVGLYEAALLALCPQAKVVASTATVRRAREQVQRLYGRELAMFPPPGVNAAETFFAQVSKKGARRYVGIAAPGRSNKTIQLRTYVSVLASAPRVHDGTTTGNSPADAYLTVVGYFNSLRELGGMRRLVEDEVRKQVQEREARRPINFPDEEHPWYRNRQIKAEPVELTSREKTLAIKESKQRLSVAHGQKESVDVVLASNMISVGVDIDRLGLMVIAGQPKTTSEYIQSSSRVGRNASRPGLVVTCLNVNKPRDRSHYERFGAYHESFYRFVEATSVTPFSGPALDRGLPGVVVALSRLADVSMTAPLSVMAVKARRAELEKALSAIAVRAGSIFDDSFEDQERARKEVLARIASLLDSWEAIVAEAKKDAAQRAYSPLDPAAKGIKPLLHTILDENETLTGDESKFIAPLSMRDVEPSVHLWVTRQPLGGYKAPTPAPEKDNG